MYRLFLVCIFFSGKFYTNVLRKLYGRITMIDTDVIPTNNNKQITNIYTRYLERFKTVIESISENLIKVIMSLRPSL
jgi:hypothetical protein